MKNIVDNREKAARAHGVSTMVITRRCVTENKKVLKRCRWVSLDDVGKTWYDLGIENVICVGDQRNRF